ncbi:MAG: DUF1801 domain-containing protein [Chlorobi bacterium]|nr:DUF1801 domain-containing protein [Chlorobiota bacterium]
MKPVEEYLLNQREPYQSIMLHVRNVILKTLPNVEEKYNYGIPFYHYNKKPLCYMNILKGTNFVDIAFVQGVFLERDFPELKDYNKRKQVRSIQIKSLEEFNELQFVDILKEASILLDKSRKAWNPKIKF